MDSSISNSVFNIISFSFSKPFLVRTEILYLSKLSKELKSGIGILVGQTIFKLWIKNSQYNVLINNSRTAWPS